MIILDHNIPENQVEQLRLWKIHFKQVGFEVGRPEWDDQQEIIRYLHATITQPLEIGWLSYTTDVFPGFDGAVWRWRYSGDSILRIVAFCPRCDMQLAARYDRVGFGGDRTTLACENCNWSSSEIEGELNEIISRVERLIQRKLRSGEYKSLSHGDR